MTKESHSVMVDAYQEMRRSRGSRNVVTATVRQLESMIRISEALARMRLSDQVLPKDVKEAKNLIEKALKESCTDKETGRLITASTGASDEVGTTYLLRKLADVVRLERLGNQKREISEVKRYILEHCHKNVSDADLMQALELMESRREARIDGLPDGRKMITFFSARGHLV